MASSLQRQFGNDAVASAVQRQPAAATPPNVAAGQVVKFAADRPFPPASFGPVLAKAGVGCEFSAKVAGTTDVPTVDTGKVVGQTVTKPPPSAPPGPASPPAATTTAEAGTKVGPAGEIGLAAELKQEIPSKIEGISFEGKVGLEATTTGGKIGGAVAFNQQLWQGVGKFTPNIEFNILRWKAGELPEIAVLTFTPIEFTIPLFDYTTARGTQVAIEGKGKFFLDVMPDPVKIASYLVETFGAEVLTSVGTMIAPAATAAVIFAAVYYTVEEGRDIGDLSYEAAKSLQGYCQSFASVLQGGGATGGPGGAEGAAAARSKLVELRAKHKHEAIVQEKLKSAAVYPKLVETAKPMFRQRAEEEFRKRHPHRTSLFGVPDSFHRNLDARLSHIGDVDDEKYVGMR